jgi:hypothetical protein
MGDAGVADACAILILIVVTLFGKLSVGYKTFPPVITLDIGQIGGTGLPGCDNATLESHSAWSSSSFFPLPNRFYENSLCGFADHSMYIIQSLLLVSSL